MIDRKYRNQMRQLDRNISKLEQRMLITFFTNPTLYNSQYKKKHNLDQKRKQLRQWMKRQNDFC